MIIYEVNLEIQAEIYSDYYQWLLQHVQEILQFDGFKKAEIGLIKTNNENEPQKIRVNYTLDSYHQLENYLTHHAPHMREQAIKKFGDRFIANRRIVIPSEMFVKSE